MSEPNCNCGCSSKNVPNQSKQNHYKSKPKSYYKHKKVVYRNCSCSTYIYIPEPYTNSCCDGNRIVGGAQGNVEKVGCECDHINKYY